jgi:hypothetical protein
MALPHIEMPSFGLIPVMPSSHPRALPHRKMLQIFFFLLWPRSAKKMEEPNPRTTGACSEYGRSHSKNSRRVCSEHGRSHSKNNRKACSEYGRSHHHGMDEPTSRTK